VIAVGRRNLNITTVFSYLNKLTNILTSYFKILDEESVKDNFVLIYELMDETIDHGYPQITDTNILKEYIKTESNKKKVNQINTINQELDSVISNTTTSLCPWRKEGIIYNKNEIYMDVVERVSCLVSSNCQTLRSEVKGAVKVKCSLSGMPHCTLGLNDKAYFELQGKYNDSMKNKTIEMDDLKFHPCVDMNKFEDEREIDFIPADGEFDLMNYRLDVDLKPLIWVEVTIDIKSETRVEYNVRARTNFKSKSIASNCDIYVPLPADIAKADFKTSLGTAKWDTEKERISWNIKHFQGQNEGNCKGNFVFPSVRMGKFLLIF
jgi:AP-1 complex subunit mu